MTTYYHPRAQDPVQVIPHSHAAYRSQVAWGTPGGGLHVTTGPEGYYHVYGQQPRQQCGPVGLIIAGFFVTFSGFPMTTMGFSLGVTALGVIGVLFLIGGLVMVICGFYYQHTLRVRMVEEYQRRSREAQSGAQSGQTNLQASTVAPPVQLTPHPLPVGYPLSVGYPPGPTLPTSGATVPSSAAASAPEIGVTNDKAFEPPPSYSVATAASYQTAGPPVVP